MKTQITLIVAIVTTIAATGITNGQIQTVVGQYQQPSIAVAPQSVPQTFAQPVIQTVPQTFAHPIPQPAVLTSPQVAGQPTPQVQPYVAPPQNQYYFGMRLDLVRGYTGTTLRVVDVTWGSPAQQAGLEVGDEIQTVNGQGFHGATDSFHAVNLMNQYVNFTHGAPAGVAAAYVQAYPPTPIANMIVRNVRNGQNVSVSVRPTRRGGVGVPAAAAPASAAAVKN